MSNSLLNIGASGLRVAELALQVAGHNIANASTPGYNRQESLQTSNLPMYAGVGYLGQGANVVAVRRIYDGFITSQVAAGQAQTSGLERQSQLLDSLDAVLSNADTGLSSSLKDFFNAIDGVVANPSLPAPRQQFLSAANTLAGRLRSLDQRIADLNNSVNHEIPGQVAAVNTAAKQLAALNDQIAKSESISGGQPANDLRDQRDQLVKQLNTSIKTTVVESAQGEFNVYIGNGQPLVMGKTSYQLAAVASEFDPRQLSVAYQTPAGNVPLTTEQIGGGRLAGLISFRDDTLNPARNALGRIATTLSSAVNTQHQAGIDLNGNPGKAVFSTPSATILNSNRNTGSGAVTAQVVDAKALTEMDYRIDYAGGSYTVTRQPDGTVTTVGSWPATIDGIRLDMTGVPLNGDSYLVRPTAAAAGQLQVTLTDPKGVAAGAVDPTAGGALDNRNAQLLAALRDKPLLDGGTTSLGNAYVNLVTNVGSQANAVEATFKAQKQLLADNVSAQKALSGVNLDEEAMNLLRYQQAYQASAKVMQTASQIFDTLLSIGR